MKAIKIDEGVLNIVLKDYPDYEQFNEDEDLRIWGEKIYLMVNYGYNMGRYIMGFLKKDLRDA